MKAGDLIAFIDAAYDDAGCGLILETSKCKFANRRLLTPCSR